MKIDTKHSIYRYNGSHGYYGLDYTNKLSRTKFIAYGPKGRKPILMSLN